MQCLGELEPDHAAADDAYRSGQRHPVEHVVVHDEPVAQRFTPSWRNERRRTGCDHHARGGELDVVAHAELSRRDEARTTAKLRLGWPLLDCLDHESDEAIALAADALHHFGAVDADRAWMHAKYRRLVRAMRRFGRSDQQLARHASDAGACCSVRARFDQHDVLRVCARGAKGAHPGSARTDDGHINRKGSHLSGIF